MSLKPVTKRFKKTSENLWTFNGNPFTSADIGDYVGFVYLITCLSNGKKYIGKKNFYTFRKPSKEAKRRVKSESDWQRYWSSSKPLKTLVKELGEGVFRREIISLHTLDRDLSYCEQRLQWKLNVLEEVDKNGERVYMNDNIAGKFFPNLYKDWESRSKVAG